MGDFAGMRKKYEGPKGILRFIFWTFIAFLPLELWLLLRWTIKPEGFWQNLILGALGLWFLGGTQLVFLIFYAFYIKILRGKF